MKDDEILAVLVASQPRRLFACGTLGMLGFMLVWLGFLTAPQLLWSLVLIASGLGAIWLAWSQYQITTIGLELTEHELRTSQGKTLVRTSDMAGIERGVMAFKPSQGFLLRTKTAQPRAWAPGIYWRLGRSIGVGGVTNAAQGKFMAETIEALISSREGPPP